MVRSPQQAFPWKSPRLAVLIPVTLAGLLGLSGCLGRLRVWVKPGSTTDHAVFGLAGTSGKKGQVKIDSVEVTPCPERSRGSAIWFAGVEAFEDGPMADQIVYGELQPGLKTYQPPQHLAPGCYIMQVWEQTTDEKPKVGELTFEISDEGRFRELSRVQYRKKFPK